MALDSVEAAITGSGSAEVTRSGPFASDGAKHDTLHVRWLGRVDYDEAYSLQRQLMAGSRNHLLLLEHDPVFTLGRSANRENILVDPPDVGAIVREVDRGGDVTLHAPGQLVGYPLLSVPGRGGGLADTAKFVYSIEDLLIEVLGDLGISGAGRLDGYTGVWLDPGTNNERKIAAIGVRIKRGRSLHGFALNVNTDPVWFSRLVPCGIPDKPVTTMAQEGCTASMQEVVSAVGERARGRWGTKGLTKAEVAWRHRPEDLSAFSRGLGPGKTPVSSTAQLPERPKEDPAAAAGTPVRMLGRLAKAGVEGGFGPAEPKPEWLKVKAKLGPEYRALKSKLREFELVTVCEEAGCPNIFECWQEGTATFMINGERCTRACGFCLVDTRKPDAPDPDEPSRIAQAVAQMGLDYAVITTVARDDLSDGGATQFANTINAIRAEVPHCRVEVLISDCKGNPESLNTIFDASPDVLNHNVETVARLQRAVRPSAGYARSLAVLSRAKQAGLTTKSSLMVGVGETYAEVVEALADLAGIGVNIVTIGQYLRPTTNHLPVQRWWTPEEFRSLAVIGESMGIDHVESSPLTRSSYHAKSAEAAVQSR